MRELKTILKIKNKTYKFCLQTKNLKPQTYCRAEASTLSPTHTPVRSAVQVTRIRALVDPPPLDSGVKGTRATASGPPPLLLVLLAGNVYFHPKPKENCIDIMLERVHIGPMRQYHREAKVEGPNLMPPEGLTRPACVCPGDLARRGGEAVRGTAMRSEERSCSSSPGRRRRRGVSYSCLLIYS